MPWQPSDIQETMLQMHVQANTEDMVWYATVDVCKGAPVVMGGWFLTDRHDLMQGARV